MLVLSARRSVVIIRPVHDSAVARARPCLARLDPLYPPGVQGTEFIESYADVLKSESCAKLLKLSDKVLLIKSNHDQGLYSPLEKSSGHSVFP